MHTRGFPKGVSYIHHPVRTTQSSGMVCSVPSESHTDSILLGKRKQARTQRPAWPTGVYLSTVFLRRTLLDTPLGGGLMKTHFPLCGRRSTERNLRSCSHDYHFSVWLPKVDCLMKYNLHVLPMSVAMFFDVCQLRWSDNLL